MSKEKNNNRSEFLKTFFTEESYQEKEMNGFWLIHHWSGQTEKWEVAVYTKEGYTNYKKANEEYQNRNSLFENALLKD